MYMYVHDIGSLLHLTSYHRIQKRLGELSDHISEINREETLFQWSQSTYPQLDSIGGQLEPFQRLFTTILKWQKAEKRIMDGTFLELNAEKTQAEVEYSLQNL